MRKIECSVCGHNVGTLEEHDGSLYVRKRQRLLTRSTWGGDEVDVKHRNTKHLYRVDAGDVVTVRCTKCGAVGEVAIRAGNRPVRTRVRDGLL